jgi:hypothetical protein
MDQIPLHLETVYQTLLEDKFVNENLQNFPDEVSCVSINKVIHSVAYLELYRKANNFIKSSSSHQYSQDAHLRHKNKISQFFKIYEDKLKDIKPHLKQGVSNATFEINNGNSVSLANQECNLISNNFNINNNVQIVTPLYNLQNIFLNFLSSSENSNYKILNNLPSNLPSGLPSGLPSNLSNNLFQSNLLQSNELIHQQLNYNNYMNQANNNYINFNNNSNNLQNNNINNNLVNDFCKPSV